MHKLASKKRKFQTLLFLIERTSEQIHLEKNVINRPVIFTDYYELAMAHGFYLEWTLVIRKLSAKNLFLLIKK